MLSRLRRPLHKYATILSQKIQKYKVISQTSDNPEGNQLGSPNCAYSLFVVSGDTITPKFPAQMSHRIIYKTVYLEYLSKLSFNQPTRSILSSLFSLSEQTKITDSSVVFHHHQYLSLRGTFNPDIHCRMRHRRFWNKF
jgi:hypothetical protein